MYETRKRGRACARFTWSDRVYSCPLLSAIKGSYFKELVLYSGNPTKRNTIEYQVLSQRQSSEVFSIQKRIANMKIFLFQNRGLGNLLFQYASGLFLLRVPRKSGDYSRT